jgi:hypothetical protein
MLAGRREWILCWPGALLTSTTAATSKPPAQNPPNETMIDFNAQRHQNIRYGGTYGILMLNAIPFHLLADQYANGR